MKMPLSEIISFINQSIYDVSHGQLMMTFFLAEVDLKERKLTYVNASHEPPMLFNKTNGKLTKRNVELLNEVTSPRLGQERKVSFKSHTMDISKGDTIFFYTDGLPDLVNTENKPIGEREFIKAFCASQNETHDLAESRDQLRDFLFNHKGEAELYDDVTFFLFSLNV